MDHLKELYHLRWSQETAYRTHELLLPLAVTAHVQYRPFLHQMGSKNIIFCLPFLKLP